MNCSLPGLPVHHQLPESTQIHVHWVGDAIQPSHPLSSPSPPTFSLSQHQGLFESVLCIKWPKYWSFSFSISPSSEYSGCFPLGWIALISLQSKGPSRVFFNTTVQTYQFFHAQPFSWSNSHIHMWLWLLGSGISFQIVFGQPLTQGPSWWRARGSANMDASVKDSGRWSDTWCLLLTFPKLFLLVVGY